MTTGAYGSRWSCSTCAGKSVRSPGNGSRRVRGEIDRSGEYRRDIRELLAEHDIFALPFAECYGGPGPGR
jgi:hypothetical protein